MDLIIKFLSSAVVICLISWLLPGVSIDNFMSALGVSAVLALINVSVKPFLKKVIFPLTILTLGIALLLLNTGIVMAVDHFVDGFKIQSFEAAILFALLCSIFGASIDKIDDKK
jgi:putative membrane protein